MTIIRGLTTVAGTSIVAGLLGTTVGYCLGAFAPSSYRALFPRGTEPGFDPIQVGIGLGCVQGLVAGAVVGLVVVVSVTWYEIRTAELQARSTSNR
jgi:hypothetical protein